MIVESDIKHNKIIKYIEVFSHSVIALIFLYLGVIYFMGMTLIIKFPPLRLRIEITSLILFSFIFSLVAAFPFYFRKNKIFNYKKIIIMKSIFFIISLFFFVLSLLSLLLNLSLLLI